MRKINEYNVEQLCYDFQFLIMKGIFWVFIID